jgi:hypothetical protein
MGENHQSNENKREGKKTYNDFRVIPMFFRHFFLCHHAHDDFAHSLPFDLAQLAISKLGKTNINKSTKQQPASHCQQKNE